MTAALAAVVYSEDADPGRRTGDGRPSHVVREEIPLVVDILRRRGAEVLTVPVGEKVLDAARELSLRRPAAVFNLCEDLLGDSSREMHFAAMLDLLGLAYTGSPPLALGLCRDKGRTKSLLRQHGIPTPDFTVARDGGFDLGGLAFPLIAKPALEDGSLGIEDDSVAFDEPSLRRKAGSLLELYEEVIVEEYVDGRELNAAILETAPPRLLPLSEIDFSRLPKGLPRICGYQAKWDEGDDRYRGTVPICPAAVEEGERERIETLSLAVFRILGMRDYGRIDWRLSRTRGLQFLEANPNPDISPSSGFLRSLRAAGMDYPDLVDFLLAACSRRSRLPGPSSAAPCEKRTRREA